MPHYSVPYPTLPYPTPPFPLLKVVRYPCWGRDPSAQEFRGHTDSVGDIVFANEDSHVITIGANDRVVSERYRPP